MLFKTTALALPLFALGSLANAQSVEYLSYGANFINYSGGGLDADVYGLGGTIDYQNENYLFNGSIAYTDIDSAFEVTNLTFRGGYLVTPDLAVYAGFDYIEAFSNDSTTFNIGGEYAFGAYTVGLNYSESDLSGAESVVAIYGGYQVTEDLELALRIEDSEFISSDTFVSLSADYDRGDTELFASYSTVDNLDIFAVTGNYDLNNGFRVGGSYVDVDGNLDMISVSGGYEVADSLWVDMTYGQLDNSGGGDADVFGLAISFETGRETLLVDRIETVQAQSLGVLAPVLFRQSF